MRFSFAVSVASLATAAFAAFAAPAAPAAPAAGSRLQARGEDKPTIHYVTVGRWR